MTKDEFLIGWKLLVLQPWGWRYNQVGANGKPTADALTQLDFYFTKLSWAHPAAWRKIAARSAEGKEWPSVQDLRHALQHVNADFVVALPDDSRAQVCECPPELAKRLSLLGRSMPGCKT